VPRRHLTIRLGKSRRRWRVNRDALAGLCDHARRTITIWPATSRHDLIDTCVHEVMHAEFPKMKHRRVKRISAACAEVIEFVLGGKRR